MASPDEMSPVASIGDRRIQKDFGMDGKITKIRNLSKEDLEKFPRGEHGAPLENVLGSAKSNLAADDFISEDFFNGLRRDHTKIDDLMKSFGETRETVNLVGRDGEGKFTRMILQKDPNGRYVEVSKGKEEQKTKKEKAMLLEDDLVLFEKGAEKVAAA